MSVFFIFYQFLISDFKFHNMGKWLHLENTDIYWDRQMQLNFGPKFILKSNLSKALLTIITTHTGRSFFVAFSVFVNKFSWHSTIDPPSQQNLLDHTRISVHIFAIKWRDYSTFPQYFNTVYSLMNEHSIAWFHHRRKCISCRV